MAVNTLDNFFAQSIKFQDLDVLANELTRIGRHQQQQINGSSSPPPPAPPPRDASIVSVGDDTSLSHDGTLLVSEPASTHNRETVCPYYISAIQ